MLGKQTVRTQSLAYTNTEEGVYINVDFKRSGNVVECLASIKMKGDTLHTRISSEFKGEFPKWACPNKSFGKEEIFWNDNVKKGQFSIIIYNDNRFTVLYNNLLNEEKSLLLQFTYIIDDSDTMYAVGDVDGNGIIEEADLSLIQNKIMGLPLSDKQLKPADMNNDGSITPSDYVILKNRLGL